MLKKKKVKDYSSIALKQKERVSFSKMPERNDLSSMDANFMYSFKSLHCNNPFFPKTSGEFSDISTLRNSARNGVSLFRNQKQVRLL